MKNKKEAIFILAIFAFSLALRLAYTFFLEHNYFFVNYPSDDVLYYQDWAKEIAQGNWIGNKAFSGMPLYPYFLAILQRLTFENIFAIRFIHLLLGSLNIVLIYFVAKKAFTPKIAVCSAILSTTNFILIYYDWLMMPVTLIITLSLLIVLSFLSLNIQSPRRQWLILGILLGFGMLADGKFMFVAVAVFLGIAAKHRTNLKPVLGAIFLPLAAGILIILALVTLRNRVVSNDWVFISAHSGINFYLGNNPQATGIFNNPSFLRPMHQGHEDDPKIIAQAALHKNLKPSEVSQFWTAQSFDFIKKSPKKYLQLLGKKFVVFFSENELSNDIDLILQKAWRSRLDINPFFVICPLALIGIFVSLRRNNDSYWLTIFIVSQLIFTLIFFLVSRHRATILPFLLIFEAAGIFWISEQVRQRNFAPLIPAGILCAVFFFIFKPIEIDPRIVEFLKATKSGYIFAQNKDYTRAQEQYYLALRLQPFDTNTLFNLGNSYVEQGAFDSAIPVYQKAVRLNPYDTDVLYNLAYAYEQTKNPDSAIETYRRVLDLTPQSLDVHYRLAKIYLARNDCPNALKYCERIIQINPQFTEEINRLTQNCKPSF